MNMIPSNSTRQASVTTSLLAAIGAAALFVGCASEPGSRVVTAPPPGAPTADTQPIVVTAAQNPPVTVAPAAGQPTIIVQQAPPAVQSESIPERPSSRHVWVAGYWIWQNDRYTWAPGQWVVPPRDGANWIPPRWEREGNAYRFYDGFWD